MQFLVHRRAELQLDQTLLIKNDLRISFLRDGSNGGQQGSENSNEDGCESMSVENCGSPAAGDEALTRLRGSDISRPLASMRQPATAIYLCFRLSSSCSCLNFFVPGPSPPGLWDPTEGPPSPVLPESPPRRFWPRLP